MRASSLLLQSAWISEGERFRIRTWDGLDYHLAGRQEEKLTIRVFLLLFGLAMRSVGLVFHCDSAKMMLFFRALI